MATIRVSDPSPLMHLLSHFVIALLVGTGFSTTGKSIKSSCSHYASKVAISKAVSSASIVDLVKIVCLQDLHDIAPPPRVNTNPLVA